ncbi:unnamed protein product [Enterobius vermicularis]|uniref:Uncharacterized protein n=1 Tax=Enterobius vermicularis TaxID=51028 RepID=A0A0N4VAT6_ENTVE|nr:unnamed protein product [Enterobius vermicularis]
MSNSNGNEPKDISQHYITDPQAKIREYATQTSAYSVPEKPASELYEEHIRKQNPQYGKQSKKQDDFIRELRDQGLTRTQRIANQFQQPEVRNIKPPASFNNVVEQKNRLGNDKIDEMIRDMEWKMKTGFNTDNES